MIRNIIFDYGSVLIKSDCRRVYTDYFGSWEKADWFRKNIISEEWVHRLDEGDDYAKCIADLQAEHPEYAEAIALWDSSFTDFVVGEIPGMRKMLMRLRADGYHLYGLSNYSHKIYDIQKSHLIFRNLEGQLISSDVHITKPDLRIFKLLLAKYNLAPEECLFIDDRTVNADAARSFGIASMVFPEIPFTRQQILDGFTQEYSDNTVPPTLSAFEKELARTLYLD